MTRRPLRALIAACAVLGATSLSSCATFEDDDLAASVNGNELDEQELADMLDSEVGRELLQENPVEGVSTGNTVRGLLSAWIGLNAMDDAGLVDEESRTAAREEIATGYGQLWNDTPAEMQDLAVLNGVVRVLLEQGVLTDAQLREAVGSAKVVVSSRYGHWDDEAFTVRPLG